MFIVRFDSKETAQRVLCQAVASSRKLGLCVSYQFRDRERILHAQEDGTLMAIDDGGGSELDLDDDRAVFYI